MRSLIHNYFNNLPNMGLIVILSEKGLYKPHFASRTGEDESTAGTRENTGKGVVLPAPAVAVELHRPNSSVRLSTVIGTDSLFSGLCFIWWRRVDCAWGGLCCWGCCGCGGVEVCCELSGFESFLERWKVFLSCRGAERRVLYCSCFGYCCTF